MTNKNRQHNLDNQKWLESELQHKDMSGSMPYCDSCNYQSEDNTCLMAETREQDYLCAKAFNKMKRKK